MTNISSPGNCSHCGGALYLDHSERPPEVKCFACGRGMDPVMGASKRRAAEVVVEASTEQGWQAAEIAGVADMPPPPVRPSRMYCRNGHSLEANLRWSWRPRRWVQDSRCQQGGFWQESRWEGRCLECERERGRRYYQTHRDEVLSRTYYNLSSTKYAEKLLRARFRRAVRRLAT